MNNTQICGRDLLDGLKGRGFRTNQGEDESGVIMLFLKRAGGYYFGVSKFIVTLNFMTHWIHTDNGAGQLIIDGKIKIKNDSTIKQFKEHEIEFEDGSILPADVVIFATG